MRMRVGGSSRKRVGNSRAVLDRKPVIRSFPESGGHVAGTVGIGRTDGQTVHRRIFSAETIIRVRSRRKSVERTSVRNIRCRLGITLVHLCLGPARQSGSEYGTGSPV